MAADAGPRSAAQHRRSARDHGRLSSRAAFNDTRIFFSRDTRMSSLSLRRSGRFTAGIAALTASVVCGAVNAQEVRRRPADGFIGGVVTSTRGPEAGVWVIAETKELKTPFIKIVVTDDAGR